MHRINGEMVKRGNNVFHLKLGLFDICQRDLKNHFYVAELLVEEQESYSYFLSWEKVDLTAARRRLSSLLKASGRKLKLRGRSEHL